MAPNFIKRIVERTVPLSTYKGGLLQARAYRILKNYIASTLSQHSISMSEWALMGQLYENPKGLRLSSIANLIGVEAPLVTNLIDSLEQKNIVSRQIDQNDKRAKIIALTPKGLALIPVIEKNMRFSMKQLLDGVSIKDLLGYIKVLELIVKNHSAK